MLSNAFRSSEHDETWSVLGANERTDLARCTSKFIDGPRDEEDVETGFGELVRKFTTDTVRCAGDD